MIESVRFPGKYIGVTKQNDVYVAQDMGREAQFMQFKVKDSSRKLGDYKSYLTELEEMYNGPEEYYRAGTSLLEVRYNW